MRTEDEIRRASLCGELIKSTHPGTSEHALVGATIQRVLEWVLCEDGPNAASLQRLFDAHSRRLDQEAIDCMEFLNLLSE